MHELSITRSVVAIVSERTAGQRVTRVRLEIGALSAVVPDAIRCGTQASWLIAGQELNIKEMEVESCA